MFYYVDTACLFQVIAKEEHLSERPTKSARFEENMMTVSSAWLPPWEGGDYHVPQLPHQPCFKPWIPTWDGGDRHGPNI